MGKGGVVSANGSVQMDQPTIPGSKLITCEASGIAILD
jgi:hypothetical protein